MSIIYFCVYIFIGMILKFAINVTTSIIMVDWQRKRLKKLNIDESFEVLTLLGENFDKVEKNNSLFFKEYIIKNSYNEKFKLRKLRFFEIFSLIYLKNENQEIKMSLFPDEYEYGKNKCEVHFFDLMNYTSTPTSPTPEAPIKNDDKQSDEKVTI